MPDAPAAPDNLPDRLAALAARAAAYGGELRTEEATKTTLVQPFLAALGYDIHDPREVTPEFDADVGVKRHEKVDYAVRGPDAGERAGRSGC